MVMFSVGRDHKWRVALAGAFAFFRIVVLGLCVGTNVLFSSSVWAAACDAVFSGGVQSHDAAGVIHLGYESRIFGGGTVLTTPRVTMQSNYQNQRGMCNERLGNSSVCTASGFPAEKSYVDIPSRSYMPASFLTGNGTGRDVNIPYQGNRTLSEAHYGRVTVGQDAVLKFAGSRPDVTMGKLSTRYRAEIQFRPGNYWINGDIELAQETLIQRHGNQPGAVNLYVSGEVIAGGSEIDIEGFSDDRPINIYAVEGMRFGNRTVINGALYSDGPIHLSMDSSVSNGVYAESVTTGVGVQIYYSELNQEHFLGSMTLNDRDLDIGFQPGDYYFKGDLDVGVGAIIRNLRGSESPVRLFVDGDVDIRFGVRFENFSDGQLLIYSSRDINITSQNDIRAFIYAARNVDIDFSNNSRYIGGITGFRVDIGQGSIVQYRQPAELGDLCTDATNVAYYQLLHASPGITCMAEPVQIIAFDENNQPVAPSAGTELVLSTTPASADWVGGNAWTFNGSDTSVVKYVRQTSPTTLLLSVSDGEATGSSELEFASAGLKFYGDNPAINPVEVPDMVSGLDASAVLWSVQTNTDTGACESRVAGNQTVELGFECRNPDQCVSGQTLSIDGAAAQANNADSAIGYATIPLAFNEAGMAAFDVNYTDVGQVRLHARLSLPSENEHPAVTLAGSSNPFVVKPHTLVVDSVTRSNGTTNPGTTGSGTGFVAAGETFYAEVEVRNAQGNRTPNFGNEFTPETVTVVLDSLSYPEGGDTGVLSGADDFQSIPETPGRLRNESLSWNEVGSITLRPELSGDDYLEAGAPLEQEPSEVVGRFYPDAFYLTQSSVTSDCGGFSYMNQPGREDTAYRPDGRTGLNVGYQLEARAVGGSVTRNYDDSLPYTGTAKPVYVAENAERGDLDTWWSSDGLSRVDIASAPWEGGVLAVDDPDASVLRALSSQPDGPFNDLQLGLRLEDEQDDRTLNAPNINPAVPGSCSGGDCTDIALGEPVAVRFGRLRMDSAFGPEVLDLPVPFLTEYWNGSEFVRSVEDSCTWIPRSAITYEPTGSLTNDSHRTVPIGGGSTEGRYTSLDTEGIQFFASSASQRFTAPGAGNTGDFDILVDLTDTPWLRFDWNQDGDHQNDIALPPANVGFGSYRGHDRIIYWREILE